MYHVSLGSVIVNNYVVVVYWWFVIGVARPGEIAIRSKAGEITYHISGFYRQERQRDL